MTVISRGTARTVAASLLLLAVNCLSFPSLCEAEALILLPAQDLGGSLNEDGSAPDSSEDGCGADCFCCCLRIRPQPILQGVEAPTGVSETVLADVLTPPLSRTASLFHPPRQ